MADEINIDLTGYKDRMGARVMPGRYTVVVDDAEQDTSAAGNPMINVWLRVVGGEFDGSVIVDRLTITDRALFRVVGFMQAIGLPTPKKRLRVNIRNFVGKVLEVDVEDGDPFNGRVKSEVRGYLRVPKGAAAQAAGAASADVSDLEGLDEFAPQPQEASYDTSAPDGGLSSQADVEDMTEENSQPDNGQLPRQENQARPRPDTEPGTPSQKQQQAPGPEQQDADVEDLTELDSEIDLDKIDL